jgi:hypothetical protein
MTSLAKQFKQAYDALSYANLGERSGRSEMLAALGDTAAPRQPTAVAPRWIALGIGEYLPPAMMAYAIGACRRMDANLLLIAHAPATVRVLLDPYRTDLSGIRCETETVAGRSDVLNVLSRRSGVLFAVSGTADNPVASLIGGRRGLLSGKSPVPVVVVSEEPRATATASRPRLAAAH